MIREQEFEDAIKSFSDALKKNTSFAEEYIARGQAYTQLALLEQSTNSRLAQKHFQLALKDFDKSLQEDSYLNRLTLDRDSMRYNPKIYIDPLLARANFYVITQCYSEAIDDLTEAVSRNENSYDAYLNRANVYYLIGDTENALNDSETCLDLSPKLSPALLIAGFSEIDLKKFTNAQQRFEKVIKLEDSQYLAQAYYADGYSNLVQDNNQEAISKFNKAIENDPSLDIAYLERGLARYNFWTTNNNLAAKDLDSNWYTNGYHDVLKKIIKDLEYVLLRHSNNENYQVANRILGLAYVEIGDYKLAEKYLMKALEIDNNNPEIYILLGDAEYFMKKYNEALKYYKEAISLEGEKMTLSCSQLRMYWNL